MQSIYLFALMIYGALSENMNCQLKPGCDLNHCDPSPSSWNKPSFNIDDFLQKKQFPITCEGQKNNSSDDVLRLYADNADNRKEIKDLKQDIQNLVLEVSAFEEKNTNAENDIQKLVQEVSDLKEKNNKTENVNNDLRKEIIELRNETRELQKKVDKKWEVARKESNKLKNNIIEIRKKIKDFSDSKKKVTKTTTDVNENPPKIKKKDNCDVKYNSKCFRAFRPTSVRLPYDPNFYTAKKICNDMGWGLANIYDVTHYRLLQKYLRPMIPSNWTWMELWTGMTYNKNKLHLASGGKVTPGEIWYPGFPSSYGEHTKIVFVIGEDKESKDQGLKNRTPSNLAQSVICEI